MTAWQLLDVKIDYDNQIQTLKDERQQVIDIYNLKRWRVNTGTTATGNTHKDIEDTKVDTIYIQVGVVIWKRLDMMLPLEGNAKATIFAYSDT